MSPKLNLEQLRKQAKERARSSGSTLAKSQFALAREHGYSSWPALVADLETATERRRRFVVTATSGRMPHDRPGDGDVWTALVLGDPAPVQAALGRDAAFANRPGGPRDWTPLHYVCNSAFVGREGDHAAVARLLLDHGADPNATYRNEYGPMSVLYGAAGVVHDPALTRLLLEAGADPNDGESLYHATEARDHACLRLLLDHGAEPRGTNALAHMLDFDDLEGVRILLEAGADANEGTEGNTLHHAVKRGRSPEIVRLLTEHGAELDTRDGAGRTPYAHAVRRGRQDLAAALAELGADTAVSPADEFVGACVGGDVETAKLLVAEVELDDDAREVLVEVAPPELLIELGLGTDVRGALGGTPLHHAAWRGRTDAVERLLALGADVEARADTQLATPLGWAIHGSREAPPGGDHVAVAERLVAAGGRIDSDELEWASDDLREWLEPRVPV